MQVPGDHWEMEFHSFETVQFGPLRVQNSNSEAFIDHSTIFDPKISQYWRVPSCFNRVLPASRNGIQAPVQKVVVYHFVKTFSVRVAFSVPDAFAEGVGWS